MLRPFEIHEPDSVPAATSLLGRYGEEARVYAGGTELLLAMKAGLLRPRHLVDVKTVPGLCDISADDGGLRIGAAATHREIERSPLVRARLPVLAAVEHTVANVRVRCAGTVGGNLCFADPHSDPGALLMALDAEFVAQQGGATRRLRAQEFFTGPYETALQHGELLVAVEVPLSRGSMRVAYRKFQYFERPTASIAAAAEISGGAIAGCTLVAGCVGPVPRRLHRAEALLRDVPVHDVERRMTEVSGAAAAEVDAVADLLGSAAYKRHLIGVLVRRALNEVVREAGTA